MDSRQTCPEGAKRMRAERGHWPKILKKRLFVSIGEFHSGPKRATGGVGGMRDAGAGDLVFHLAAAAGVLVEV